MFDGFELTRYEGEDGVRLRVRHGGSGPAVLLLHGHPRTHATWHRVAPLPAAAGHDVLGMWRDWAGDRLEGGPVDSGPHMAEEAPEALVAALRAFWRNGGEPARPL
ncbi:pimeloyl-ACP methyl ester carboxylesterase [Streptomyces sp. SAI-119]|nr:pimeloyl-ACP methyl ester carboxylesterase [Streptomyces sp. SAI-119]